MGVSGRWSAMAFVMMISPMGDSGVTTVMGESSYFRVMPPPAGRRKNWWSVSSSVVRMTMDPRTAVSGSSVRVRLWSL